MDEESTRFCYNCKKYVVAANFLSHSAFCQRNFIICEICNESVPKNSMKEHEEKNHVTVMRGTCRSSMKKCLVNHKMEEPFVSSSSPILPFLKPPTSSSEANSTTTLAAKTAFVSSNTENTFTCLNSVRRMTSSNPTTTSTFLYNTNPYVFSNSSTSAAGELPHPSPYTFQSTTPKKFNSSKSTSTTAVFTSSNPTYESSNAKKVLDIGKLKISVNVGTLPSGRHHPLSMAAACAGETPPPSLQIGDRVVWINDSGPEFGVVKWLGKLLDFSTQWLAGVEFDNPVGTGTGKYKNRQLFYAKMNHASLVPISGLMKANDFLGYNSCNAHSIKVSSKAYEDRNSSSPGLLRCIICIEKERDTVFQPCGHLVVCSKCANNLKSKCPVCRRPVQNAMKVYIN